MGITGGGREEIRGVYAPFAIINRQAATNATNTQKQVLYACKNRDAAPILTLLLKPELKAWVKIVMCSATS
ncbi:hypothetical protein ABC733_02580 [Mangrovibacter sp. SLW1]